MSTIVQNVISNSAVLVSTTISFAGDYMTNAANEVAIVNISWSTLSGSGEGRGYIYVGGKQIVQGSGPSGNPFLLRGNGASSGSYFGVVVGLGESISAAPSNTLASIVIAGSKFQQSSQPEF